MTPRPPAAGSRPTVGLWVHRPSELSERTGLGRYGVELVQALHAISQTTSSAPGYVLLGGREPEPVTGPLSGVPVGRSWPPRQLLHLAWLATGRPRFERVGPRVDLLHVLYPSFPLTTRAKLVGTIHDLFPFDHPEWFPGVEGRAVRRSIRSLVDHADRIVCVSGIVGEQLVDRFGVAPERIRVVHSGVAALWWQAPWDAAERRARRGGRRPYVVAVGQITPRKNLGLVIEAIERLEDVDLVLVGKPGPMAQSVLARIDELGVVDRVRVTGPLPAQELVDLVRGAELLVHPSLAEGFGFPPIEAMAVGTPAVVASSGSVPEIVGDAGLVLPADDPDPWAAAIHELVADPERRDALVEPGRRRAEAFSWDAAAAATVAVHHEVLSAPSC